MPAYHCTVPSEGVLEACTCAMLPLKTTVRGPATAAPAGEEDVIDNVLNFFRANVLFRNFEVKGGGDRTLIYLTLFTVMCLVKAEKIDDKASAIRELKQVAIKPFPIPGDANFPLTGLFPSPADKNDGDNFRSYFKQAREELTVRLCERLYNAAGTKNKWWQSFSKRKFMGKEMKE